MNSVVISLRVRLVVAFIVLTALAVGAVSSSIALRVSDALLADSGTLLHARADSEARLVGAQLDAQIAQITSIGLSDELRNLVERQNAAYSPPDPAAIRTQLSASDVRWADAPPGDPLLQRVLSSHQADDLRSQASLNLNIAELLLTDRNGGLVAASSRTSDYDQSDEEWWQQAAAGQVYIGSPSRDQSSDSFSIIIAVAIADAEGGELIGVIRSTYRTDAITLGLTADRFGVGTRAALLVGGQVLQPGGDAMIEPTAADAATLAQVRRANYTLAEYDGQPRLIALAAVATAQQAIDIDWAVLLYQSRADALAPVSNTRLGALITALLVLAAVAAAAFVISGLISAPIQRITAAAERIAAGNLAERVGLGRRDEIGRLAQSFDHMTAALQERIAAEQQAQAERLALQQEMIAAQDRRIAELSAPSIPLGRGTLLLPLIGAIDRRRAEHVLQTLLADVAARRASTVILDLSGVRHLDAEVIVVLLQAVSGVRLLGARVVLAGLRAEVARAIVDSGIPIDDIPTYASLQDALDSL